MPDKLALDHEWVIGPLIAGGGFGQVFEATSDEGETAVVKLVPKAPGASREMLFVDLNQARNVVPIIDSGDWNGYWALVMPRAEKSLRQHIDQLSAPLSVEDAVSIMRDICTALADLDGKVVHRDLKPENVLLLGGRWCLADFGISRYADASTAPDTRKHAMTPAYAAPERWRDERAESAVDIYALGIMAYELLTRSLPFPGPEIHDFRDQHLSAKPPLLQGIPFGIQSMITECLLKSPGARPNAAQVLARLELARQSNRPRGLARLEEANAAEVAKRGETDRMASIARSEAERREALFRDSVASLRLISDSLFEAITQAAPAATIQTGRGDGRTLGLGVAQLELLPARPIGASPWNWTPPAFDVVATSGIVLRIPSDRYGYEGRSHSLWFCDAREEGRYRWHEAAFMFSPLIGRQGKKDPFALDPGEEAAKALWTGMAEFQLAWPLDPVNVGELDEFIDRWATWFADASQGGLARPSRMPERATPKNWR